MASEPAATGSYRAVATRSGAWWAITIPELPGAFSQCKRLDQVEAMAREVIALMLDTDPADVAGVEVDVQLPDPLADDLAALRRSEQLADDARQAAAHAQRRAAGQHSWTDRTTDGPTDPPPQVTSPLGPPERPRQGDFFRAK